MKKNIISWVVMVSLFIGMFSAWQAQNAVFAEKVGESEIQSANMKSVKDETARNLLQDAIVFAQGSPMAIVNGAAVKTSDPVVNDGGKNYVPIELIQKVFPNDNMILDTKTIEEITYVGMEKVAEEKGFQVSENDGVIYLSKSESPAFEKNSLKLARLFGIFVSPEGADTNSGTYQKPFQTIQKAKNQVRNTLENIGYVGESYSVYMREGIYPVDETIEFTKEDSGSEACCIVYQSYNGEEVILDGGVTVRGNAFQPVRDKESLSKLTAAAQKDVVCYDLSKIGFKPSSKDINPTAQEVFYNGDTLTIARWPNIGYTMTGEVLKATGTEGDPGIEYVIDDERVLRWKNAKDAWVSGYFTWDWYDEKMQIKEIDMEKRTISTVKNPHYQPASPNKRWFIYNLLEEVDMEGECYIDRDKDMLYLYPYKSDVKNGNFNSAKIQIPTLERPMLNLEGSAHITFKGLTFEDSKVDLVTSRDAKHVTFEKCTARNTAKNCFNLHGENIFVQDCEIYNAGASAVMMDGGDRDTLTSSHNEILNNRIFNNGRIARTNNAAVKTMGVGTRIAHNEMFNNPHLIVSPGKNDTIFEYNEIYDALTDEAGDAGTYYVGRDLTTFGNVIRYNYFHDLPANSMGVIYLDDHGTGYEVYGNIFYNTGRAYFNHGGSYNTFNNNIIIDKKDGADKAVYFHTARRYSWDPVTKQAIDTGSGFCEALREVNEKSPAWLEKYPQLNELVQLGERELPTHSQAINNVVVMTNGADEEKDGVIASAAAAPTVDIRDNIVTDQDIGFVDMEHRNFNLKEDAEIFELLPDFERIDFEKIGLKKSENRTEFESLDDFNLISPQNGAYGLEAREIQFKWKNSKVTRKYRFTLATDRNFKNIIRDEIVLGNMCTVKNLRYDKTRYYWRVESLSMNAKNIEMGAKHPCSDEYYSFETKQSETVDFTAAQLELETGKQLYSAVVEGTEPGQYLEGTKAVFKEKINGFEALLNSKELSQREVNNATEEFKNAIAAANGRQNIQILPINNMLKAQGEWDFQENRVRFGSNGFEFTRGSNSDNASAGYKARKIQNYQILHFKTRLELADNWMYFGLRANNTLGGFSGSDLYFVLVKKDVIELQKRGGGSLFITYENDCIRSGEIHDIEYGALDTSDGGVQILFKVDGKTIIDYVDNDAPLKEPGYFTVYNAGTGKKMEVMPVDDAQSEIK